MAASSDTRESRRTNVLLTFSGRKSYLVAILAASPRLGRLVATDADPGCGMSKHAPEFTCVPDVSDPGRYVEALLGICRSRGIDCVLALNDMDLVPLAEARPLFRAGGTRVAGVSAEVARLCMDKLEASVWLAEAGFAVPKTALLDGQGLPAGFSFPVVVKARHGQGSAGLRVCTGPAGLHAPPRDSVVQELVEGREYNLDILVEPTGQVVSVVPKLKLEMRWGSTDRAVAVHDPALIDVGVQLGEVLRCVGSIDVDIMGTDRGPVVLDINPRIGGGFPFTASFCPKYVDALLAICAGESPAPFLGEYVAGRVLHREFRYL